MKKILYFGLVLSVLSLVFLILISAVVMKNNGSSDDAVAAFNASKDDQAKVALFEKQARSYGRLSEDIKKVFSVAAGLFLANAVLFGLAILMPEDGGTPRKDVA